jgi:hypothetical protein
MPDAGRAIAVVAVTALVVIGLLVIPTLQDEPRSPSFPEGEVEFPEWDPATLVAEQPDDTGAVDPDVDATGQRVLIDDGHANRLARAEYRPLIHGLTRAGFDVDFFGDREDLATELDDADAFIVLNPGRVFSDEEVDAVNEFTEDGGQLVMAGEPTQGQVVSSGLGQVLVTAYNNLGPLASSYGITFSSNYIYDLTGYAGNYRNLYAEATTDSRLTEGVDRLVVYTATAVEARSGTGLFETGAATIVKGTESSEPRSVVWQHGNVTAIGDTTLFSPDRYTTADNDVFIENLVEYLAEN